jgi:hypothetical protein
MGGRGIRPGGRWWLEDCGNLSDGRVHHRRAWSWLESRLSKFGGGTSDTALQRGWYIDPDTGMPVRDLSRRYVVAMPQRSLALLRALLREACWVFRQKCIYLSVAGHVEFVEAGDEGG